MKGARCEKNHNNIYANDPDFICRERGSNDVQKNSNRPMLESKAVGSKFFYYLWNL
jgi:hypothetical protein